MPSIKACISTNFTGRTIDFIYGAKVAGYDLQRAWKKNTQAVQGKAKKIENFKWWNEDRWEIVNWENQ